MTDHDFSDFAALWQQEEQDPSERKRLAALAQTAQRHGRLVAYADIALAVLLIGGSALFAVTARGAISTGAGVLFLIVTVWVTWKRRQIRDMATTLNTSCRHSFLESSIRNARASLRRVMLSLAFAPAFVSLALIAKFTLRPGESLQSPVEFLLTWAQSTRGLVTLSLMALFAAYMLRSRRNIKAELRRLAELSDAYEEEASRERGGPPDLVFPRFSRHIPQ